MGRKLIPPEPWWSSAAALMVKHDLSLRQAAQELGIELTIEEAETIKDRVLFKEILEKARAEYFSEIGASSALTKERIVGMALKLAERLAADHEDAKSSEALLRLSKILGWVGFEPPSSVLETLNQRELDEVKRRLRERIEEQQQQPQPAESTPAETKAHSKLAN